MKTKYSISILMLLTILFCFTSCQKDEIDTWVSLEADKTTVAVNETVSFTMSGNAETYVVYTGDAGHDFTKSYLVVTGGKKVDQEAYVLTQAKLDLWIPILTADIATYNIIHPTSPLNANTIIAGLTSLVDKSYYKDTAAIRIRELMPTLKTFNECQNRISQNSDGMQSFWINPFRLDRFQYLPYFRK
jgi:hypothetical protein